MLNSAFDAFGDASLDFYPGGAAARDRCDQRRVYENVNNGVYKAGFATTQEAYEEAFRALFNTLDELEERLGDQRFLLGDRLTEADWRLFTTLVRFDAVYYAHFKCNRRRIADYPNLSGYLRDLYQMPGVKETVDFDAHQAALLLQPRRRINPTRIVPLGPLLIIDAPHDRDRFRGTGCRRSDLTSPRRAAAPASHSRRRAARRRRGVRRQRIDRERAALGDLATRSRGIGYRLEPLAYKKGDVVARIGGGVPVEPEEPRCIGQAHARLLADFADQRIAGALPDAPRRRREDTSRAT